MISKVILILLSFATCSIHAQSRSANTVQSLLQLAETNYPLLKSKALVVEAAGKGIDMSKNSLIPSLDAGYQVNYATYNNITGMNYPQLLMPISGPPAITNNYAGVFGSALSVLANWQPITFGQRSSQTAYAKASYQYAQADAANELFAHMAKVINAYLDAIVAKEFVKIYEENLKRTGTNLSTIRTLVINGIKPGVDSALLQAEVSRAKVELLTIKKLQDQTQIILSQLLATDSTISFSDSLYFHKLPVTNSEPDTATNPVFNYYKSGIALSQARRKAINATTLPTLGTWASGYARGSGVDYTGNVKSVNGLGLQRYNYGVGLQLSIPILQAARIKPQLQQQDLLIRSATEKLNEISLQLRKQEELAAATLTTALNIAAESPIFFESANYAYRAMQSRYQSGLANFSDLVQAQYGLLKAETDNKAAYISAWKALLFQASVKGDLNLFIKQLK